MWEFKVLVFAPGHSPGGVRARVSFHGDSMLVQGRQFQMSVPGREVRLKTGGYDGRQWMLTWTGENGEVSAALQGDTEIRLMRQYAPPALAAQLGRATKAARRRQNLFRAMAVALIVLLLLPLLLAGLFWLNSERISAWVADHISLETEQRLGELSFTQLRTGLKLRQTGPAPDMVRRIGERLTAGSAYRYQWFVADNPEVNAFAMPGGYVVVNTGLLKAADSAEEVAGVLAHEVQHVELRHSLKNLIHQLGWRAVLSVALGDLSGGVWVDIADHLGGLEFSRDLEREADMKGLETLRKANIAPGGMASFFAKLAQRDGTQVALLSSHPTSQERLDNLNQAIASLGSYAYRPLPFDWKQVRGSLP